MIFGYRTIGLATPVEDPIRFAAAQAHFATRGVAVDGWVYGLHKDTSGLITTHPYMVDRPEPDAEPFAIGPHPVNIWVGHYMIWNALRISNDYAWIVLECDARFPEDWYGRMQFALDAVPTDADLVYLGSCCTGGREVLTRRRLQDGAELVTLRGTAPQCNHAYLVTRAAAEILCTTLRKVWAPIDIQQASECWGSPLPRAVPPVAPPARPLRVYTVLPRIVDQFNTDLPV